MRLRTALTVGASLTLLAMGPPSVALAGTITVTSWGGSYSASQRKAYYEPFMAETEHTVLEDEWDGSIGLIRAMVETGNYKTHLIDGSVTAAQAGCDEGFLETIDYERLGMSPDDFIDSNILVYMFDSTDLSKRELAVRFVNQKVADESGCISFQVVQETLNVVIGKMGIAHENGSGIHGRYSETLVADKPIHRTLPARS